MNRRDAEAARAKTLNRRQRRERRSKNRGMVNDERERGRTDHTDLTDGAGGPRDLSTIRKIDPWGETPEFCHRWFSFWSANRERDDMGGGQNGMRCAQSGKVQWSVAAGRWQEMVD